MATSSFDWQRVGAATIGTLGANFVLHTDDVDASTESLAMAQRALLFDANVLGGVRAGRSF